MITFCPIIRINFEFYFTSKIIAHEHEGANSVEASNYVIPAFCLNPNVKIELKQIIDGESPKFVLVEN